MIYFFHRAGDTRSCEIRLEPYGHGYELVVTEGRRSHIEHFADSQSLERRQSSLRYAWLAHGWRDVGPDDNTDDR
jgi:hypothetical protein